MPRHEHWHDTHRPAKQERGVHPPWSWKPQSPMEVGHPKVFIRLKVSICIYVYMYVCMYVCICVYIYIYIYIYIYVTPEPVQGNRDPGDPGPVALDHVDGMTAFQRARDTLSALEILTRRFWDLYRHWLR